MKCKRTQLDSLLVKGVPLCAFISGDEPFLVLQSAEKIRAAALANKQVEHMHHLIINEEQLAQTVAEATTGSLFSAQRFCEIHLELPRITTTTHSLLHTLVKAGDASMPVLIVQTKREKTHANKQWVKFCVSHGIWIEVWPLNEREHYAWLEDTLAKHSMFINSDGLQTLFELTTGNLVAGYQEIQKLSRMFPARHLLSRDDILSATDDNAKFSFFQLLDNAFEGKKQRVLHSYQILIANNVDPIALHTQLVRQLYELLQMSMHVGEGNRHQVAQKLRLWPAKQKTYEIALRRLQPMHINRLLRYSAKLEHYIKGVHTSASPALALQGLLLAVAGEKTPALSSFTLPRS